MRILINKINTVPGEPAFVLAGVMVHEHPCCLVACVCVACLGLGAQRAKRELTVSVVSVTSGVLGYC